MQIGGLDNHSASHHVTQCIHDHSTAQKKTGRTGLQAQQVQQTSQSTSADSMPQVWNLGNWLSELLGKGRNLIGRIWGNFDMPADNAGNGVAAQNMTTMQQGNSETAGHGQSGVAMAQDVARTMGRTGNLWFVPVENQNAAQTVQTPQTNFRERVKIRFSAISSFLSRHMPMMHSGTSSGMKEQKKEENLTRRSRYRDEDVEIDVMLTDDSYLLDSYGKNGEYKQIGK